MVRCAAGTSPVLPYSWEGMWTHYITDLGFPLTIFRKFRRKYPVIQKKAHVINPDHKMGITSKTFMRGQKIRTLWPLLPICWLLHANCQLASSFQLWFYRQKMLSGRLKGFISVKIYLKIQIRNLCLVQLEKKQRAKCEWKPEKLFSWNLINAWWWRAEATAGSLFSSDPDLYYQISSACLGFVGISKPQTGLRHHAGGVFTHFCSTAAASRAV